MSVRRPSGPRPEQLTDRASHDGLRLRFRLSRADAAALGALQADDEAPADTIKRLIRTAAMVRPILDALQQRPVSPAPAVQPTPDDLVQRQADAVPAWLQDD